MDSRAARLSWTTVLVAAISAAVMAFVVASARLDRPTSRADDRGTLKARVLERGSIRCAYVAWPPGVIKDPNTGTLSGICVDAVTQAARNLSLELKWTEEVAGGTMIEGLLADRYDLVVAQVWPNAARAKRVAFATPLYFSGIGVYVRQDDHRFDESVASIDKGDVRLSTIDGEMSSLVAATDFPSARTVSLPQLSDLAQMMLNVVEGKADATIADPYNAREFLKNNAGSLRNLTATAPLRVFGNSMIFRQGESEFEVMINTALTELINSGYVDRLIKKYEGEPGTLYRPARPYRSGDR